MQAGELAERECHRPGDERREQERENDGGAGDFNRGGGSEE